MKRFLSLGSALAALAGFAMPALGQYYVAGDFQGWDPGTSAMTDNLDGTYSYGVTGLTPGSRHEFKVTIGNWSQNWPSANSWFIADGAGNAQITWRPNSAGDGYAPDVQRIGVSPDFGTWTAVGNWQHFTVTGSDWNNADPASVMTHQGGGVYAYSIVIPTPGTYEYKAVNTASWDAIGTDTRNVNAATWFFTTTDPNQTVDMLLKNDGAIRVDVQAIPEPVTAGLLGAAAMLLGRRRR